MKYINEDEIVNNKTKLYKVNIDLENYDMYYVDFLLKNGNIKRVHTFCEKGTFPDFNSSEFKKLIKLHGTKLLNEFFAKRLLGQSGLMNKEGRDDYIYLGGDLFKDGYFASRYMIQSNGKTGQQNFDENLFNIKLKVQAQENSFQKNVKDEDGKTYVIGDIHGMYRSYVEVMKKLKQNDKLIILGDVIDRGNGGVKILQDILKRKQDSQNGPEITFMMGNHEMQFLETIEIMKRRNLKRKDLATIMNRRTSYSNYGRYRMQDDLESKEKEEEWKNKYEIYDKEYQKLSMKNGLTRMETENILVWIYFNKGSKTIFDFLDENVNSQKEQQDIIEMLYNSYVALPQNINGQDYLFVHAMPPKDLQMLKQMKENKKGYRYNELKRMEYRFMLEERKIKTYRFAKDFGFTTICGHTPEVGKIIENQDEGYIRLDAACGHMQKNSKLALYCIEDGTVEFIDEKEKEEEVKLEK